MSKERKMMVEKENEKKTATKTVAKKAVTKKTVKKAAPKKKASVKKVSAKTETKKVAKIETKEPKTKLDRKSKKYRAAFVKIEKDKNYTLAEAVSLAKDTATTKFDSSVEIHLNLNTDPKNAEHALRGSVSLPAGLGKSKKIAVVCGSEKEKEAKEAGASLVGGKDLIEKIAKGEMDFEVLVATPEMMPELAKAGKILGPKGLMPNPKDNTVTNDIKGTLEDIKKGRAEYRSDGYGIIHSVIGKASFTPEKLLENAEAFLATIHNIKPAGVKGTFIKSIYVSTTMGPSVKVKE
jgi:large subunit ribosomal protein L1